MAEVDKRKESALNELVNQMGYTREQAEQTLKACKNDVIKAKEKLLKKYGKPIESCSSKLPAYSDEPPPPYSEVNPTTKLPLSQPPLFLSQDKTALFMNLEVSFPTNPEERCCCCFDPIRPDPEEGFTGEMVWQGLKAFHAECYLKNKGPKCEHCCFALIAYPHKNLSGKWGIYDGNKYHEECYNQYAAPRCSSCCDIICPNEEEGLSGRWHEDNNKLYHEECFAKKVYLDKRAKFT